MGLSSGPKVAQPQDAGFTPALRMAAHFRPELRLRLCTRVAGRPWMYCSGGGLRTRVGEPVILGRLLNSPVDLPCLVNQIPYNLTRIGVSK